MRLDPVKPSVQELQLSQKNYGESITRRNVARNKEDITNKGIRSRREYGQFDESAPFSKCQLLNLTYQAVQQEKLAI